MKKSEAAKELEEFFLRGLPGNRWITHEQAVKAMDFLIRELGMLPPVIQGEYNTLLTPPTINPSGTSDQGFHRGWEPEE